MYRYWEPSLAEKTIITSHLVRRELIPYAIAPLKVKMIIGIPRCVECTFKIHSAEGNVSRKFSYRSHGSGSVRSAFGRPRTSAQIIAVLAAFGLERFSRILVLSSAEVPAGAGSSPM